MFNKVSNFCVEQNQISHIVRHELKDVFDVEIDCQQNAEPLSDKELCVSVATSFSENELKDTNAKCIHK